MPQRVIFMKKILSVILIMLSVMAISASSDMLTISEGDIDGVKLYAPDGSVLDAFEPVGKNGMVIQTDGDGKRFTSLFGDIYPSAGMIRRSTMQKHTEFCQPEYIESSADTLFSKLRDENYLRNIGDMDDYINALAYYMGEMEALHPFMDGNGRATRFFFHAMSLKAGYEIGWGSADPDHFLEANVAALDGDYQALIDVLEEIIIPLSND